MLVPFTGETSPQVLKEIGTTTLLSVTQNVVTTHETDEDIKKAKYLC